MVKQFLLWASIATIISCNLINGRILKSWKSEEITLDLDGKYRISWEVDIKDKKITFDVNVETTGYIGLGISPNGGMKGADFFIGGVDADGNHYHSDRHLPTGSPPGEPLLDEHNDWDVLEAGEINGITRLKFSRLLNTCDDEDYPISENDTVRLIWAIGTSDILSYHEANKGSVSLNIIEPEGAEEDPTQYTEWKMTINSTMPSYETSYWCTIHKRPLLNGVKHIVGFDAFLEEDSAAKRHTHHFIIYKCRAPNGQNPEDVFEEHLGVEHGEQCYGESSNLPKHYCVEYLFVWAIGGKATWFPKDVGYPIEENSEDSPYYMMEIHYDNPQLLDDVTFEAGVTIYHTAILRDKLAGLMTVGTDSGPSLIIPPNESSFIVAGHCASACTNHFPEGGIWVFNILLHSHFSGRKLKLRQFRDLVELPWMLSDSNYDFNFQQNKPITNHIKVLQGDHLVYECDYDSTWNNNQIVFGGLSTRREMCQTFLWYYPRQKIDVCGSTYNLDQNFLDFGITNYTIEKLSSGEDHPVINAPPSMAGLNYSEALSTKIDWTPQYRQDFQQKRRFALMDNACVDVSEETPIAEGQVAYPDLCIEYIEDDQCTEEDESAAVENKCPSKGANISVTNFFTLASTLVLILICKFYSITQ